MRHLLDSLTRVARGQAEAVELCNLGDILAQSCLAAGVIERDDIALLLDVPLRIRLPAARTRVENVFANLIVNAMEAMPGGGWIRITAVEAGQCVLVRVEDNGPGIPAEIRGRLFEPFVTARRRDGLGLGLAISRQSVREHGGDLWVEPATGAHFVVSLPLLSPFAGRLSRIEGPSTECEASLNAADCHSSPGSAN